MTPLNMYSSIGILKKYSYGIGFAKKTKKGFEWGNSESQLEHITYQNNVAELINKHGISL